MSHVLGATGLVSIHRTVTRLALIRFAVIRFAVMALALIGALLSFSSRAQAYPQFALKGFGDCADCHHSPTGGGLPNSWGRQSVDASFGSDTSSWWGHGDLDGSGSGLKLDLGADVRLLPLASSDGDATIGTFIPMLTEVGGALGYREWVVYGTLTARNTAGSGPPVLLTSREHWLEYKFDAHLDLRVGRMVLPFGIRQPDHTEYVRSDFGFDMWDQSYGLELDWRASDWSLFVNAFAGDLTGQPSERQDRGGAATLTRALGDTTLGVSVLGSISSADRRVAGSLFTRTRLVGPTYALAEVAAQHRSAAEGSAADSNLDSFLRVGWFARTDLDVYLEAGQRALIDHFAKQRVGVGANWQVLHWFEFAPEVLLEARENLPARFLALGQLHFIY
jgi:hypothetical protein